MKRRWMAWWTAVVMALGGAFLGVSLPTVSAHATDKKAPLAHVTFVTNWFAEAEHGGFYAADQLGIYKRLGLDVTIQQGGPQVQTLALLASGKVQFAMANADQVIEARAEGLPVVAVFATFQTAPQALMYHQGSGIKNFANLSGHTIYVYPGQPWWPYIIDKYHLKNYKWLTANGTLSTFATNKNAVLQIYITDEPYFAMQKGLKVGWLPIANSGFNIYQGVVVTTEQILRQHPNWVKAFVQGSQLGWRAFFKNPTRFFGVIRAVNPQMTNGAMLWATEHERPLIEGGDAARYGIGYESLARYQLLERQLLQVKFLKKPINVSAAFTNRFLLPIR